MTIYLTSPTGGYAVANTEAGAAALESVSSFQRTSRKEYERQRRAATVDDDIPLHDQQQRQRIATGALTKEQ